MDPSMPRWAKVVLIASLAGLVLMFALLIFAGRWVRGRFDSFEREGDAAAVEGRGFGAGKEAEACVAESLERVKGCSFVFCEAKVMSFMGSCLDAATTPPGYCDTAATGTNADEWRRWKYEECERRGWGANEQCVRVVGVLQLHCAMEGRDRVTR